MRKFLDRDRLDFLFDENPAGGSGPAVPASATPPAAPAATPADPILARLQVLEQENARFRAEQAAATEKARREEEEKLLKAGQADALLKSLREKEDELAKKHDDFVARTRKSEMNAQLSAALAGHGKLVPHAGEQLQALWASEFEAVEGPGGATIVRSRTDYLSPQAFVAAKLADPKFSHFLAADHRGGSGSNGAAPVPNAAAPADDPEAAIFQQWQQQRAAQASGPVWQRDFMSGLTRNGRN